jgi:hypothetical protein
VDGDVVVLNGPVSIGGRVRGRVLAINSDVVLRPSARIDGDLLVVGGEVEGRHAAFIGGEIRIYRQQLQYERDGEFIRPVRSTESDETGWWRRWERSQYATSSKLFVAAGAYNRVEGLPIVVGPQIQHNATWGTAKLSAHAIVRTETSFNGEQDDIGHNVNGELRLGRREGLLVGAHAYNSMEPTEQWQLTRGEASLAAFVLRRDYRDYYERRGGRVRGGVFGLGRGADLTASYGEEVWSSRVAEAPWSLFYRSNAWRPNPAFDDGRLHKVNGTLRVDTRNDVDSPWSGWYILTVFEHGWGDISQFAPRSDPVTAPAPAEIQYARAFMDFRRYNRISPDAQLNFRVVLGGWMNGDPLPLQRRFAVDGPGGLPGYDFRTTNGVNLLTCTNGAVALAPGHPGQCDRMALASVEYRGDLHFDLFTDWEDDHYMRSHSDGVWVFFADAGRGWLVGTPATGDELTLDRSKLPKLSTFKSNLGLGLDFDIIGLYAAKAMAAPKEPANFFVRIRHRF